MLLAAFPFALPALLRWPFAALTASFGLYIAALQFGWNLPGYPGEKVWFFNPMAWQAVFYTGAVLAVLAPRLAWIDRWRWPLTALAVLYLLFAGMIVWSWHDTAFGWLVPDWLGRQLYPIDKTNLDILRFAHFLALAWLVRLAVRPGAGFLRWPILTPIRRCGEHSLQIFCLGTFLALTAEIVVAYFDNSVVSQVAVSFAGIALMSAVAYGATWFKGKPVRKEL